MVQGVNFSSISSGSNYQTKESFEARLLALGIPSDVIKQGPDAVKEYADTKSITLPPPPAPPNSEKTKEVNKPESFQQKLMSLGIPQNIVIEGKDAVTKYAQEHNILLPAPPNPPQGLDMDAVIEIQ